MLVDLVSSLGFVVSKADVVAELVAKGVVAKRTEL